MGIGGGPPRGGSDGHHGGGAIGGGGGLRDERGNTVERLAAHLLMQKSPEKHGVDHQRLSAILGLAPAPSRCFLGRDEFLGYVAFAFDHTPAVVLECPAYGNATYILRRDWKRLSQLPKRTLLEEHSDDVTRVVHSIDWAHRLQGELARLERCRRGIEATS